MKGIFGTETTRTEEENDYSSGKEIKISSEGANTENTKDISLVQWSDIKETFVHRASNLRYWPKQNVYYANITDEGHDYMVLYYEFVDGFLTLIQEGTSRAKNKEKMKEKDKDRRLIITKKLEGYHPDKEKFC